MAEYYTIGTERAAAIVERVQRERPQYSEQMIHRFLLADWPEGDEHQNWLDTAPAAGLVDWIIAGLDDCEA